MIEFVKTINFYLSDYVLVFLLLGTGIFYSVRTKFVQIRCFKDGVKKVLGSFTLNGGKQKKGMSSFQALSTAISAQVGTGNIVGSCGAILIGGPGAIFWMLVIAFLGMATIYAEAVLAQQTRIVKESGTILGGPVYYIQKAFKGRFGKILAGCFAVSIVLALGFMGIMVQSNSIGETFHTATGLPSWTIGLVLTGLCGFIFFGGTKRIASVTEKIVPVMAGLYILGGILVLAFRIKYIPESIMLILKYAFVPNALIGGSIGYALKTAISQGAKRGLFSNEAGMGSTPHAHAMADVACPHDQGVTAMFGVFLDTFVVLMITALVVVSTLYAGNGPLAAGTGEGISKTNMTQIAFSSVFGNTIGSYFISVCLFFFAFSTIVSWNFFGRINIAWLFGKKSIKIYYAVSMVFIFLGSCLSNDLVWELTDFFNQLMVIPNIMALIALSSDVISVSLEEHK